MMRTSISAPTLLALALVALTAGTGFASASDSSTLVRRVETSSTGMSSTGSSSFGSAMSERILQDGPGGLVLEYDIDEPQAKRRLSAAWMFPVRVSRRSDGTRSLLNEPAIADRLEGWLRKNEKFRPYCGRTIFSVYAIKIECDPAAALEAVAPFDLHRDLTEGAPYTEPDALVATPVRRIAEDTYAVSLKLDPEALRCADAEMIATVAQVTREGPATIEAALASLARFDYAGERTVTFVTDTEGRVVSRTRETIARKTAPGGAQRMRTVTDRVKRNLGR